MLDLAPGTLCRNTPEISKACAGLYANGAKVPLFNATIAGNVLSRVNGAI